jgi:hypothetical protein
MEAKMNSAMLNPNTLITDKINIVDRRGRKIGETTLKIARILVAEHGYYAVTTSDISWR